MQLIRSVRTKLNSIRRRILVAVSAVYLLSSAISAVWIYAEISHEVDELFDAEMVQQAKTLLALLPLNDTGVARDITISRINAHSYEDKLAYRIETTDGKRIMQTEGSLDPSVIPFKEGFSVKTLDEELWHSFGLNSQAGDYRILLLQQDEFRSEIRGDLTTDMVVPILTLLPLILWLGWWTINRNFSSFRRLAEALRRKRSDDYKPFAETKDTEEVALVKGALNHYLKRIEQTFLREKQFSADAAHELRTPLASLKAQLQNQWQKAEAQQQKEELESLLASTERLVSLVESLLLLSKTELPPQHWKQVNAAAILRQVVSDYYQYAEWRQLTIDVNLPTTALWRSEERYLTMLFSNLVDNAIKYAAPNSSIEIQCDGSSFIIRNRIETSHHVDAKRLTERFYRGGQLRAEGSGLGLSIVSNLARQLGLKLTLALEEGWFVAKVDGDQALAEKRILFRQP
ncbi:MAG: histidine kinase dimerization/phospho-acceptor domain-containing protein [Pseudomonadota bacterium]